MAHADTLKRITVSISVEESVLTILGRHITQLFITIPEVVAVEFANFTGGENETI